MFRSYRSSTGASPRGRRPRPRPDGRGRYLALAVPLLALGLLVFTLTGAAGGKAWAHGSQAATYHPNAYGTPTATGGMAGMDGMGSTNAQTSPQSPPFDESQPHSHGPVATPPPEAARDIVLGGFATINIAVIVTAGVLKMRTPRKERGRKPAQPAHSPADGGLGGRAKSDKKLEEGDAVA